MNRKSRLTIVLGIIVVAVIISLYVRGSGVANPNPSETTPSSVSTEKNYTNRQFGIAFTYPEKYVLSEQEVADPKRPYHAIVLIDKKDIPIPEQGEGPTAITLSVYPNLSKQTLLQWYKTPNGPGFGSTDFATTTIQEIPAITYTSTGLYEFDSTAFIHGEYIVVASVGYINVDDVIRTDSQAILGSLKLTQGTTTPELI